MSKEDKVAHAIIWAMALGILATLIYVGWLGGYYQGQRDALFGKQQYLKFVDDSGKVHVVER